MIAVADLRPAYSATRARLGLVALLLALAAVAWWITVDRMEGMDAGPGTHLGALGWFVGVWVVMMAAMMFPSVAPAVALYSQTARRREPLGPLAFAAGYLLAWAGAGVVAYAIFVLGDELLADQLAWDEGGRWVAGSVLALAAAYELTPAKRVCLGHCRSPSGFRASPGLTGSVELGARHGAWCVGCCWALMAALFALGVMSIAWMVVVAAIIALEKVLPWGRLATYGTAAVLVVLAVLLLAAPDAIPGLTVPGEGAAMGDGMSPDDGMMMR